MSTSTTLDRNSALPSVAAIDRMGGTRKTIEGAGLRWNGMSAVRDLGVAP